MVEVDGAEIAGMLIGMDAATIQQSAVQLLSTFDLGAVYPCRAYT